MRLEWTLTAQADRESIYDYIETDNPHTALNLDERFQSMAIRLVSFPYLGRFGRVQETRELIVHKHYILIYEVEKETVRILRVLNTSQQWPQNE